MASLLRTQRARPTPVTIGAALPKLRRAAILRDNLPMIPALCTLRPRRRAASLILVPAAALAQGAGTIPSRWRRCSKMPRFYRQSFGAATGSEPAYPPRATIRLRFRARLTCGHRLRTISASSPPIEQLSSAQHSSIRCAAPHEIPSSGCGIGGKPDRRTARRASSRVGAPEPPARPSQRVRSGRDCSGRRPTRSIPTTSHAPGHRRRLARSPVVKARRPQSRRGGCGAPVDARPRSARSLHVARAPRTSGARTSDWTAACNRRSARRAAGRTAAAAAAAQPECYRRCSAADRDGPERHAARRVRARAGLYPAQRLRAGRRWATRLLEEVSKRPLCPTRTLAGEVSITPALRDPPNRSGVLDKHEKAARRRTRCAARKSLAALGQRAACATMGELARKYPKARPA